MRPLVTLVAGLALGAVGVAQGAENYGPLAPIAGAFNKVTADQQWLSEKGIDVHFGYLSELGHNFTGGTRVGSEYADEFRGGFDLDLQKLIGWSGASFHVWLTNRNGFTIDHSSHTHNFEQLQEIAGRGSVTRITKFYLRQALFKDRLNIKLGLMGPDEDFDTASCDFIGLAFCGSQVGDFIGDTVFDYPISNPGAVLRFYVTRDVYLAAGAYAVDPERLSNRQGFNLGLPGTTTGGYFPAEVGWHTRIGDQALPGDYQIGGWYETADSRDVAFDQNGVPFLVSGQAPGTNTDDSGLFLWGKQQLTERDGDSSRGLFVEGNLVLLDSTRSSADRAATVKLTYHGLFDIRPHDIIGVGLSQVKPNSNLNAALMAFNHAHPNNQMLLRNRYEYQVDAMYRLQVLPQLYFQPEVQYLLHPGGFSEGEPGHNIWALALRSALNF